MGQWWVRIGRSRTTQDASAAAAPGSAGADAAAIIPYPQYWAFLLSGVAASEATSIGCHTDLWNPAARTWSSLVDRMGWQDRMPATRPAGDRLGPVLPALAAALGLEPGLPVLCGIHDSNASLYPHLVSRSAPFSVVSTGTWVVVLAIGGWIWWNRR